MSADPDTLITLRIFEDPVEAMFARSVLESAGIAVFEKNENMSSLYPPMLTGGIQLQVRSADQQTALEILDSTATDPLAANTP